MDGYEEHGDGSAAVAGEDEEVTRLFLRDGGTYQVFALGKGNRIWRGLGRQFRFPVL